LAVVEPIPAASVLLLRDAPLEVLMILRHESSSFVPSTWVFPGGRIETEDGDPGTIEAARSAAIRETFEETGIRLESELVATSRWITPEGMPKRFDTLFFLTTVPRDVPVKLQEAEAVDFIWISPADALARIKNGEMPMVFPTIRNLEALAGESSAAPAIDARRGAVIEPVQPRMVVENGRKKIVLP
jgi:8-oxo-dGTP pyrophosphatase MutT (NUDIX family)